MHQLNTLLSLTLIWLLLGLITRQRCAYYHAMIVFSGEYISV